MRSKAHLLAWIAVAALGSGGCATMVKGKVTLADERGTPLPDARPEGVTVNFINLEGKIEDSLVSVLSDPTGKYQSPKLPPGQYKVEAFLPGYAIETVTLKVKGGKKVPFTLKRIKEARGKSIRESEDDNIPNPGDVQIGPPGF
jgi:hypothetical protein